MASGSVNYNKGLIYFIFNTWLNDLMLVAVMALILQLDRVILQSDLVF